MHGLTVMRWHARYLAAALPDAATLRAWDAAPARVEAPGRLLDAVGDALVCVRRVRLTTRLGSRIGEAALADRLGAALQGALEALLEGREDAGAVWYGDRRAALADMLYRGCCGDVGRAWAWRQLGLLDDDATPAAVRQAAVLALCREPHAILPVLAKLVVAEPATGSLTALTASLPAADWAALLDACPQAALVDAQDRGTRHADAAGAPPHGPIADALLRWAAERPRLAHRQRASLLRLLAMVDLGSGVAARSALSWAEAAFDRAVGAMPPHPIAQAALSHRPEFRTAAGRAATLGPPHASPVQPPVGDRVASEVAPSKDGGDERAAPALPDAPDLLPTEWAGLPFLIPLLPATGLIEAAGEQRIDALRALGLRIGAPDGDPGLRALAGGALPARPLVLPDAADALAAGVLPLLEAMLSARLGVAPAAGWLHFVCRRPGRIRLEPGWIEVHFALDAADPALRRAALDLDPGWVPWLGCVVRHVYG